MSWDEIVGLALTSALIGGAVGAALGVLVARRIAGVSELQAYAGQTYSRWLGARLSFSRASATFVSTFRALAAERRDSPQFALRMEEAQRARASWSEASRDLDFAEAMLLTNVNDLRIDQKLAEIGHISAEELRVVVSGDSKDFERLLQKLHAADQRALAFIRDATANARGIPSHWGNRLAHQTTPVRRIVDRWSRSDR